MKAKAPNPSERLFQRQLEILFLQGRGSCVTNLTKHLNTYNTLSSDFHFVGKAQRTQPALLITFLSLRAQTLLALPPTPVNMETASRLQPSSFTWAWARTKNKSLSLKWGA